MADRPDNPNFDPFGLFHCLSNIRVNPKQLLGRRHQQHLHSLLRRARDHSDPDYLFQFQKSSHNAEP